MAKQPHRLNRWNEFPWVAGPLIPCTRGHEGTRLCRSSLRFFILFQHRRVKQNILLAQMFHVTRHQLSQDVLASVPIQGLGHFASGVCEGPAGSSQAGLCTGRGRWRPLSPWPAFQQSLTSPEQEAPSQSDFQFKSSLQEQDKARKPLIPAPVISKHHPDTRALSTHFLG